MIRHCPHALTVAHAGDERVALRHQIVEAINAVDVEPGWLGHDAANLQVVGASSHGDGNQVNAVDASLATQRAIIRWTSLVL